MLYEDFKQIFEQRLEDFCNQKIAIDGSVNLISYEIIQQLKVLITAKGKRLRPWLVYLGANLVKPKTLVKMETILQVGLSLEIFHTFCLIHDDIIDKATTRRGIQTMETYFSTKYNQKFSQDAVHLGRNAAILGGDLAMIYSQTFLDDLALDSEFYKVYRQMQIEVCLGQNDDSLGMGLSLLTELKEEGILKMLDLKSGRYSLEKPLLLGATLANLEENIKQKISQIGINIGLIFQLTDDILGVFGQAEITGKSVASDILEGKRTWLIYQTYQQASNSEKRQLEEIFHKAIRSNKEVEIVKKIMEKYNIKQKTLDFCQNLIQENEKLFSSFEPNENLKFLQKMQENFLTRSF